MRLKVLLEGYGLDLRASAVALHQPCTFETKFFCPQVIGCAVPAQFFWSPCCMPPPPHSFTIKVGKDEDLKAGLYCMSWLWGGFFPFSLSLSHDAEKCGGICFLELSLSS
eukprot:RCo011757